MFTNKEFWYGALFAVGATLGIGYSYAQRAKAQTQTAAGGA